MTHIWAWFEPKKLFYFFLRSQLGGMGQRRETQEGRDVCVNYDWFTLVYSRDHHNTVKQLSAKNKSQLKSCHGHLQRHHHTKSILYCRSHLQRNEKDHFKFYCSVDEAQIFHWLCYLFSKYWFFQAQRSNLQPVTYDLTLQDRPNGFWFLPSADGSSSWWQTTHTKVCFLI